MFFPIPRCDRRVDVFFMRAKLCCASSESSLGFAAVLLVEACPSSVTTPVPLNGNHPYFLAVSNIKEPPNYPGPAELGQKKSLIPDVHIGSGAPATRGAIKFKTIGSEVESRTLVLRQRCNSVLERRCASLGDSSRISSGQCEDRQFALLANWSVSAVSR